MLSPLQYLQRICTSLIRIFQNSFRLQIGVDFVHSTLLTGRLFIRYKLILCVQTPPLYKIRQDISILSFWFLPYEMKCDLTYRRIMSPKKNFLFQKLFSKVYWRFLVLRVFAEYSAERLWRLWLTYTTSRPGFLSGEGLSTRPFLKIARRLFSAATTTRVMW